MGIPSINTLANMEYMLYGGTSGSRANCPSYSNGYCSQGAYNSTPYGYGYPAFGSVYPNYYTNNNSSSIMNGNSSALSTQGLSSQGTSAQSTSFQQGITQEDIDKLADYYAKNNVLEEGFLGAAGGGLSWMAWEHAQSLVHPLNANKGFKAAEEIFKNVPKEFMKKNPVLSQEAWRVLQQATRDTESKWFTSGWLRKPIPKADIQPYIDNLKNALAGGKVDEVAKATVELDAARGMDGKLAGLISKKRTVAERIAQKTESGEIAKNTANLINISQGGFGSLVKSTFKKDFVGFMAIEALGNAGKIFTAFGKDTETGVKQTGQSLGKSALGVTGWCLGRAAGTWLGAKAGAVIGSAICPGAGTVAGAVIGFVVGSIGMWAGHKLGNWILGQDVADKVEAEKLAKSPQGQAQLLQFAAQKAQEGKTDAQTNNILMKALSA